MNIDTVDALIALLRAGRSSEVIGAAESVSLEFKAESYRLLHHRQRQELAKDLSALANGRGGAIAIGFKTEKEAGRATDSVVEARPFPRNMFDEEQWRKIAAEWVYPSMESVDFDWYSDAQDKGFVVLRVPEQRASIKPFLITRSITDEDRVDGVVFGMFERRHTDASPLSVEEVQSLLRDGMVFRTAIDARAVDADASSATSADVGRIGIPPETIETTIARAARLIETMHLAQHPTYVLTATPYPSLPARQMFLASDHPVVRLLHRSPEIRSSGFDMDTGRYPEIVGGESRRSFVDGYKGKEFWSDGTLIFVATGGPDFLSWGNRDASSPLIINQVVLVESVLLFTQLFVELWKELGATKTQVELAIHLARMCPTGEPPVLRPGPLGPHQSLFGSRRGPACEFHQREMASSPFDPAASSYSLVARVYEWFGLEHDRIPYSNGARIDAAQIAQI